MIIDFESMPFDKKTEFLGGKGNFYIRSHKDNMNNIMSDRLEPGASIGYHKHETNSEIIYILSGKGKILYEGEYFELFKGMCHYCKIGKSHSLINDSDGDLIFFAVVPEHGVTDSTTFVSP